MIVHIKNINASHERLETFLNQLAKGSWSLIKDTYTIKDVSEEKYHQVVDFEAELLGEGFTIFVKQNGL